MAAREDAYRFVHEFGARMARGDLNEAALTALAHNPLLVHLAEIAGEGFIEREQLGQALIELHDRQFTIEKARVFDLGTIRVITPKMLSWLTCGVIRFDDNARGQYRMRYIDDQEQRRHMGETGLVMPSVDLSARQVQKLLALGLVQCDLKFDWTKVPSFNGHKLGTWKVIKLDENYFKKDGVNRRKLGLHHADGTHMWSCASFHELVLFALMIERHPHFTHPEGLTLTRFDRELGEIDGACIGLEWVEGKPQIRAVQRGESFNHLLETWVDYQKVK